jgi:hypothetical protein
MLTAGTPLTVCTAGGLSQQDSSGYYNLIIKTKTKLAKYIEKNNTTLKIIKILAYKNTLNHVTYIGCEISLFLRTWILMKQQFIRDRFENYS